MLPMHVAVVPYQEKSPSQTLSDDEQRDLLHVTAALQIQVVRDLGPLWGISATVSPFLSLADVPPGYWPLALVDELPDERFPRGLHFASGGKPFAIVLRTDSDWSRLASHELMELLCDPWGNRTAPGRSLETEQGQVEYLVEVSDPCQNSWYTINGVIVSDFVTPQYYDPLFTDGGRYSFTGVVKEPRSVLAGGYVTWREPVAGDLFQAFRTDDKTLDIGRFGTGRLPPYVSLREWVDGFPAHRNIPELEQGTLEDEQLAYERAGASAEKYGQRLHADIERLFVEAKQWRSRAVQLSAHSDVVLELYKDLAKEGAARDAFKADPVADLARRGIMARGIVRGDAELPPPEEFQKLVERIEAGDLTGQPAEIPFGDFWWLGVYAVYART
jgi:hypothetical protein